MESDIVSPTESSDPDLHAQVCAFPNLLLAARKAAKGKRGRAAAARFEATLPDSLIALRDALRDGTYQPEPYSSFTIHEPKRRLISAAAFRDRVVHHALCNVIEPIFDRSKRAFRGWDSSCSQTAAA